MVRECQCEPRGDDEKSYKTRTLFTFSGCCKVGFYTISHRLLEVRIGTADHNRSTRQKACQGGGEVLKGPDFAGSISNGQIFKEARF